MHFSETEEVSRSNQVTVSGEFSIKKVCCYEFQLTFGHLIACNTGYIFVEVFESLNEQYLTFCCFASCIKLDNAWIYAWTL